MKRIFLFARDPGGANVILPIYEEGKKLFEMIVYAKDFALQRLIAEGIPVMDIQRQCQIIEEEIYLFLKNINPDIVVTGTSLDDYTERYLWQAAERLHIKSYAILDQWVNLGIRFSKYTYLEEDIYIKCHEHDYLPYRILAMDELSKQMLMKDGISEKRIVVTGQPYLDVIYSKYQQTLAVYDEKYWNIVFVSEPISHDYDRNNGSKLYWGYNERTIFQQLYRCLLRLNVLSKDIRLIIRPHPREDMEYWDEIVSSLDARHIKVEIDKNNESFAILKSADVVCGMSSMFLLEAAICKKQILSVQIGLCQENPFVLDQLDICYSVLTEDSLFLKLTELFNKLQEAGQREIPGFPFIKNAAKNILSVIGEVDNE